MQRQDEFDAVIHFKQTTQTQIQRQGQIQRQRRMKRVKKNSHGKILLTLFYSGGAIYGPELFF